MQLRAPMIVASTFLVSSVAYLLLGREYPVFAHGIPGPGLFPLLIGLFWLVIALADVAETWRGGAAFALSVEWTDVVGWGRVVVVVVVAALFIALLELLGDLVAVFLVVVPVMRVMGTKSLPRILGTAVVMALISHLLFVTWLHVPLPRGIWNG